MTRTILADDRLTVSVVPGAGARIAQLSDRTGRDWLVETDRPEPAYADDVAPARVRFEDGTRGGWDECLPSVAAGPASADHGELWFRAWRQTRTSDVAAEFIAPTLRSAQRVTKAIRLLGDRAAVSVELRIQNTTHDEYLFLYSAHPLWRWTSDARLELPGAGEVRPAFGRTAVAPGRWPRLGGEDLSRLPRRGARENFKVFVAWAGRARLSFAGVAGALLISQLDPVTPWLGVCVNRDLWPADEPGESWIALEPTTSPTDSLDTAAAAGTAATLAAGASLAWTTTVEIEQTP